MNAKLILTIVIVVAAIYFGTRFSDAPMNDTSHTATHTEQDAAPAKKPAIGGAFSLVNQDNEQVSHTDLHGRYALVFFGFSHCPDMCPMALAHMTAALESLPEAKAAQVKPVLISVDPKRDTPERLKEYAAHFHPSLLALTGTQAQVDAAAKAFKVYHQVADPSVDDYMVNHSGFIYLMNPEGDYITHFNHTTEPETMAAELERILE